MTTRHSLSLHPAELRPFGRRGIARLLRLTPVLAGLAALAIAPGCGQNRRAREAAALSSDQVALNVQSFDQVWDTIRDSHWDPTYNGVNLDSVRETYRPRVENARTMGEARTVINDSLDELKQSHFGIIPGEAYAVVEAAPAAGAPVDGSQAPSESDSTGEPSSAATRDRSGTVGMSFRFVGDDCLVTMLRAGMPAEQAGVRTGYKLVDINGRDPAELARLIRQSLHGDNFDELLLTRAVESRLAGPVGSDLSITVIDEHDRRITKHLTREPSDGAAATFGNLPTMYVTYDSAFVRDTNIGYIGLNLFFDPMRVMPALEQSISDFRSAEGIILDLRGNPGGIGAMAMGVAGWFVDQDNLKLGTMQSRDPRSGEYADLNFVIIPRAEPYTGPLAILVDRLTGSTSEILAGGMQDLQRARIFGENSAGAALPSQIAKLPNGDGFQYAFANYVTTTGRQLEGLGVAPDVTVHPDRGTLLRDEDPVINAAIEWIRSNPR